mmetsp:Transcript_16384/g.50894  ORF Transcript_16384/g.50894 Transcript_16384/m.50894 type:complete len:347 (+) Transcript_16384:215-1255(+)
MPYGSESSSISKVGAWCAEPVCSPSASPGLRWPEKSITQGISSQKKEKSSPIISGGISRHADAPKAVVTARLATSTSACELTTGGYIFVVHVSPSAVVCTAASRKSSSASHPCASAMVLAARSMALRRARCADLDIARKEPPTTASLGMTLSAPPPATRRVTLSTTGSSGSESRLTASCSACTSAAAATTGSRARCGCAACPPTPRMVATNLPLAAAMGPPRLATTPVGSPDHVCTIAAALAPSAAPSEIIRAAPAPPSSAGCQTSRTVPRNCPASARSLRILAAPSSMAECASCPQACILPAISLLKGTSTSSRTGRPSRSARRMTMGSPCPTSATTPVTATGCL